MTDQKKKREPGQLSELEKLVLERWTQGPTHFLKDGNRWFEVTYRWRPRDSDEEWQYGTIGKVCKTPEFAGRHIMQKISQGHRMQVEILRVTEGSAEAPIQTGAGVDVVDKKTYQELAEKRDVEIFEHQDELDAELYRKPSPTAFSLPSKKTNGKAN